LCKRTKWSEQPYFRKESEPCPFNPNRRHPNSIRNLSISCSPDARQPERLKASYKDLRKSFIESALDGELTHLLGYEKHNASGRNSGNSRNGSPRKRIKTDDSEVEVQVPRDRNGEFEPQLIAKHQRRWDGFDETILALYARGMTTRDIQSFLREKCDIDVSPGFISSVCESVSAGVQEWRTRQLQAVWPILYLDALFLKVRNEGRVIKKALYIAVGVNLEGRKELLGLWLGEGEGAKFYLQLLNELASRGVEDIFIACVDGLKGLPEAIESIFPKTTAQTCVVHLARHSLNFVGRKERKAVASDLKTIYESATETEALQALEKFQFKWDKKYSVISRSWRANWARVKPMFELPAEIRRVVCTTNVIESLNFSLRKIIKGRCTFPNDDSVYRLIYLGPEQISRKWTMPIRNWKAALQQFAILSKDRLPLEALGVAKT
jgi:putative transposase